MNPLELFRRLPVGALTICILGFAPPAHGQSPRWQRATPFGGPLVAVAEAPSASSRLYTAAANGRFYRSTNGGASWQRRAVLPLGVKELSVAPQDFLTVYARTDSRLLRSRNGGHTWKDLGPAAPVALDPDRPGVLFAATREGLFRSTDHGDTFSPWSFANRPLLAVAIDPHASTTLYVVADASASDDPLVVWKSGDGGLTWANAGLSVVPETFDFRLPRFVFDLDRPGTLYVVFASGPQLDPIFRSRDDGASWTQLPLGLGLLDFAATTGGRLVGATSFGTSRSLDGGATWNPPLPGTVATLTPPRDTLVRLVASSVPNRLLAAGDAGFWRSENGGAAWRSSNLGIQAHGVSSVAVAPAGPPAVYATAGYGVFRSTDEGDTWTQRYSALRKLSPLSIEAFHPEDPTTLYATGFDGVASFLARSTNGARDWSLLPVPYNCNGGSSICDVGMSVVGTDPRHPDAVYVAGNYFFHFGGRGDFLLRSDDGFETYEELAPLNGLGSLIVDAEKTGTFYAVACVGFHESRNGGNSWTKTGRGLPDSLCPLEGLQPVMVRDPRDPDRFYVGTLTQGVFASNDGGATFRAMNRGLETTAIESLLIAPQYPTRLYVGVPARGVFAWNAARGRWTPLNQGLPLEGFAGVVTLDRQNPSRLYAASPTMGVYRLDLDGAP